MRIAEVLVASIRAQISAEAAAWLEAARRQAATGPAASLLRAYTDASRHLGRTPLALSESAGTAQAEFASMPPAHLTLEDAGRVLLLLERYAAAAEMLRGRGFRAIYELVRMELPVQGIDIRAKTEALEFARWAG